MPSRTPWYPPIGLPVHVGWYERDWGAGRVRRDYWDGRRWYIGTPEGDRIDRVAALWFPWRGLAEPVTKEAD